MVARVENKTESKNGALIWAVIAILVASGIAGFYYFSAYSLLLRVISLLVVAGVSFWLFSLTDSGKTAIQYWRESLIELRKVVWPTKNETIQTTIAVVIMIFAMSLFLWFIDSLLLKLVAKILN